MEEIYIIICLKKETKIKGIPKKLSQCKTVDRKIFDSFFRFYKKWNIDRVDIKKIVLHKKDSYGNKGAFKYFIGYNDYNDGIIPLYIKLPMMNAIAKYFNDSKDINILVYGKKLLKNIMQ